MCNVNMCELCKDLMPASEALKNAESKHDRNFKKFIVRVNDLIKLWSNRGKYSCVLYFEDIEPFSRPNIIQLHAVCEMLEIKGYKTRYVEGKNQRLEISWCQSKCTRRPAQSGSPLFVQNYILTNRAKYDKMGGPFSRAAGRKIVSHPAPFVKRKIEQILARFEIPICAICQLTSACPCGTIQLQKGRGRQPERDFKKNQKRA